MSDADIRRLIERGNEISKGLIENLDELRAVTSDSQEDLDALAVCFLDTLFRLPAATEAVVETALGAAFFLGWKAREGVGDLSAFEEDNDGS